MLSGLLVSTALAALLVPPWLRDMLRSGLARANYSGRRVAFPSGAVLVAVSLIALAPLAVLDDRADLDLLDPDLRRWLAYVIGVAMLGLLDDALGGGAAEKAHRGWRGHARAVAAGRFSTGAIKAAGGLALAAYAVSGRGREGLDYVADVALLLLATNLFNLLDLRPGRSAKAFVLLGAGLTIGTRDLEPLWTLGLFAGAVLVVGLYDLRERTMLGDAGSNVIGALAGLWIVLALDSTGQLIALMVMIVFTVYGEFRSIGALIEKTPLVRQLDSLGRPTHA
jgi:UDP-GlcNAc:undecaprenyl-phosphate/decaprenyl-phosphate GlcNAc-1-phosphate transferase